jgi:hypothetical protein
MHAGIKSSDSPYGIGVGGEFIKNSVIEVFENDIKQIIKHII